MAKHFARKKASRLQAVMYSVAGQAIGPLAGFLTAPILAHALGVTGRGEATAATAPLVLGVAVLTMGLPEATTYFVARHQKFALSVLYKSLLLIIIPAILGTLGFIALGPYFAGYNNELVQIMFYCTLMLLPSLWVGVLRGAAFGLQKFSLIAAERTLTSLSKLGLIAVFALTGHLNVLTASLIIGVTVFLGGILYLPLMFQKPHTDEESSSLEDVRMRLILQYGLRQWFGSLAGVLLSRLDQLLMTPLSSSYELGLYVVAVAIGDLVLVVNNALREVVFSTESKAPQGERIALAARVSNMAAAVTGSCAIVIGIWMIPILFGEEFAPAWIITVILIIAAVMGNPGSLAGVGLSAAGRPELRSWSLVAGCIVNLLLMLWLVPQHGAVGAAFATMGGSVTAASGNLLFTRKVLGTKMSDFIVPRREDITMINTLAKRIIRK
ncbi:oligosaccharide flippase family protein [Rothia nasimurium]|uniref:oligosaccharide flippase family protein n=1 Tax=Rothia nasimurium TaxID=85336 RepID=UPI001F01E0BD|nr:oligosaccharide flippase family protein [Rothia nasimurium]